ncbi:hypothetical protein U1Q18_037139 [Sarracenia purpurea var. burkii]
MVDPANGLGLSKTKGQVWFVEEGIGGANLGRRSHKRERRGREVSSNTREATEAANVPRESNASNGASHLLRWWRWLPRRSSTLVVAIVTMEVAGAGGGNDDLGGRHRLIASGGNVGLLLIQVV